MGICPRCGSGVDEGEPYCPECCYDGSEDSISSIGPDLITVNGTDYYIDDVVEALEEMGYNLDDLERGFVDEEELEEYLQDC